ncbi:MAG: transglycosylase SLT domain-containing protein, partial [Pseudorhodoplanes sp.]|nr:transglycosylase SLT domain-containing protein [Pseudorhodoplanes sp.]
MMVDSTQSLQAANVTGAIQKAARITGTNFQYLLATAKVESNLNPAAAAKTSSAGGLFQFIEQTWLQTLKESGAAFGYGHYADAIAQDASGRFVVPDPRMRAEILDLRRDPTANALMAGAFTQSNAAFLKERLGRAPSEGELYIAHFMGASGAARLIGQAGDNPDALAADAFPNAARANRSVFFDKSGRARDFGEVAAALSGKFDSARARAAPAAAMPAVAPALTAQASRAYEAASPLAIAQRAAIANGEPLYANPYR